MDEASKARIEANEVRMDIHLKECQKCRDATNAANQNFTARCMKGWKIYTD